MTLTELTPLELNQFRFSGHHTPLTPEQIEQMHAASADATDAEHSDSPPK